MWQIDRLENAEASSSSTGPIALAVGYSDSYDAVLVASDLSEEAYVGRALIVGVALVGLTASLSLLAQETGTGQNNTLGVGSGASVADDRFGKLGTEFTPIAKPEIAALPTPRLHDGKPDLSGVWETIPGRRPSTPAVHPKMVRREAWSSSRFSKSDPMGSFRLEQIDPAGCNPRESDAELRSVDCQCNHSADLGKRLPDDRLPARTSGPMMARPYRSGATPQPSVSNLSAAREPKH